MHNDPVNFPVWLCNLLIVFISMALIQICTPSTWNLKFDICDRKPHDIVYLLSNLSLHKKYLTIYPHTRVSHLIFSISLWPSPLFNFCSLGCGNTKAAVSAQVYSLLEETLMAKNKAERDLHTYTNLVSRFDMYRIIALYIPLMSHHSNKPSHCYCKMRS